MALCFLRPQCLVFILLTFCKVNSMQDFSNVDPKQMLNSTTFDCSLIMSGTNWTMKCDSSNFDFYDSSKFFASRLQGSLNVEKPIAFADVLQSISFTDSKLYVCDSEWRYFILSDVSTLSSNCDKRIGLRKLVYVLNKLSLIKIEISHNEKLDFTLNLLSESIHLQDVLIYGNNISNMSFLPVHSNNTIKVLSLKRNFIQRITDGLFAELSHLKTLDLSYNLLQSINKKMFNGISQITNLDLSNNIIEYIQNDALRNLSVLKYISLRKNKLQNIDADIFRDSRYLSTIDISHNNLKRLPSALFQNMHYLRNVSCLNCSLNSLDKDIFQNSTNMVFVVFNQNNIETLHSDMFKNLNILEVLDLADNKISQINGSLFSNHPYLMYVNMSANKISKLYHNMFIEARNVRYLDFSQNRIVSNLTDEFFKNFTDLEVFSLSQNKIMAVELGISGPVRVRKLDISYNLISKLQIVWKQLVLLEIFHINNNFLTILDAPPCIPNIKQTITFAFQYNRISKLNIHALLFDENRAKTDRNMICLHNGLARNYVNITHNPLVCDCKLYPFYKYIQGVSPRKYQIEIFVDKENIICDKPDALKNQSLATFQDDMLVCLLNENCPLACDCGIRGKDNSFFVNCSLKGLREIPQTLPREVRVLYFRRNQLKDIKSLNNLFLRNATELYLDYNLLSNLEGWKFPLSLRHLSLVGNQLKILPIPLMHFISNLTDFQLFFGNNNFTCECDRKDFKYFLIEHKNFIQDNSKILCNLTDNTFNLVQLTSVVDSVLCPQAINSFKQLIPIIILAVFFSVLIVILLLYYTQRQLILSYFYVHCRTLYDILYADVADDEALFDAFVAYSSADREIVLQLIEELENNPPFFELCIHERNWLPGQFITDNIAHSVENSRRTIIVLSSTFISSPWFNVELRAAVCKMAQDAVNRIIVILTNKTVSFDDIDPELRYVVSKRTYLEWGERWFWEKLRYALPRKKIATVKLDTRHESISEVALIPYKNKEEI